METANQREASICNQACIAGAATFYSKITEATAEDIMLIANQAFENAMKLEAGGERISYLSCFKNAAEFLKNKPFILLGEGEIHSEKNLFKITKQLFKFNREQKNKYL